MTTPTTASTSRPMKSGHRNGALPKVKPAPGEASATAAGALTSSDAEDPPTARSVPPLPVDPNSVPPNPPPLVPPGDPGPPGVVPPAPFDEPQLLAHGVGGHVSRHGVGGAQFTMHPVGGVGQLSKHGVGRQFSTHGVGPEQLSTHGVGPPQLRRHGVGLLQLTRQGVLSGRETVGVGTGSEVLGNGSETVGVGRQPTIGGHPCDGAGRAVLGLADAMIPTPRLETAKRIKPASAPTSQRGQPGLPRRLM
jgi:hypothetical protein